MGQLDYVAVQMKVSLTHDLVQEALEEARKEGQEFPDTAEGIADVMVSWFQEEHEEKEPYPEDTHWLITVCLNGKIATREGMEKGCRE